MLLCWGYGASPAAVLTAAAVAASAAVLRSAGAPWGSEGWVYGLWVPRDAAAAAAAWSLLVVWDLAGMSVSDGLRRETCYMHACDVKSARGTVCRHLSVMPCFGVLAAQRHVLALPPVKSCCGSAASILGQGCDAVLDAANMCSIPWKLQPLAANSHKQCWQLRAASAPVKRMAMQQLHSSWLRAPACTLRPALHALVINGTVQPLLLHTSHTFNPPKPTLTEPHLLGPLFDAMLCSWL